MKWITEKNAGIYENNKWNIKNDLFNIESDTILSPAHILFYLNTDTNDLVITSNTELNTDNGFAAQTY